MPRSPKRRATRFGTLSAVNTRDEPAPVRYWRPASSPDVYMLRVEQQRHTATTFSERYAIVIVREGAFEGWYRGAMHVHAAGQLKLKEPGEVHRGGRVFEPYSIQVAAFTPELVARATSALGLRAAVHFRRAMLGREERATARAFAMHAALVSPETTPLEAQTRVSETLASILEACAEERVARPARWCPPAVRRARDFLESSLAEKVTLDELAARAELDKFHLVRAFRAEVGVPPYAYLTHLRVARASTLLARGASPAEAAQAVGLYDESQLHRHFRRIVGTTPGRFARSLAIPARRSGQHRPSHDGASALPSHA
jgi:AraC-like DNA-binding protein